MVLKIENRRGGTKEKDKITIIDMQRRPRQVGNIGSWEVLSHVSAGESMMDEENHRDCQSKGRSGGDMRKIRGNSLIAREVIRSLAASIEWRNSLKNKQETTGGTRKSSWQ